MLPTLLSLPATILHAAMMLAVAPLLTGVLATCEARLAGRRGPAATQPYRDLQKLLRKVPVLPDFASGLYGAWPFVCLAANVTAALLTPSFCFGMATAPFGDVITFIGLLGLARAAAVLAGLETGFGAGGAGAARAALAGALSDTALLVVLLVLALAAHSVNLDGIGVGLRADPAGLAVPLALVLLAAVVVALADTGVLAVGGQAALVLEYSGRYLALFQYAAMVRLALWLSLLGSLFFPFGMARATALLTWPLGILLWLVKLAVLVVGLALLRRAVAAPRPMRVVAMLGGAVLLGLLAAMLLFVAPGQPA